MKETKILLAILTAMLVFFCWFFYWQAKGDEEVILSIDAEDTIDETELEKTSLINKVDDLVHNQSISTAIVESCMKHTEDYRLCIRNIIWVSSAESSIFTKWMTPTNNWFWRMYQWKKKRFSSVEDSIYQWVHLYVRNWREKRTTADSWLAWKYCASQCSHWISNYNSAVNKLDI